MRKAENLLRDNIKAIDATLEVVDSRIPLASSNDDVVHIFTSKPKIILLNKVDLADVCQTKKWISYFRSKGISAIAVNSLNGSGVKDIWDSKIIKKLRKKSPDRALRFMVYGMPNVGKSSLINRMVGKKSAGVGNKPGVTRGKQWLRLNNGFEILDTPGISKPKFNDQESAKMLAFCGCISDDALDISELALELIKVISSGYPGRLEERYKLTNLPEDFHEIMDKIAAKRGFLISGGGFDYDRCARTLLDEFRSGKFGRITFESAPTKEEILEEKLHDMSRYEINLRSNGAEYIAGVDEVGRGPLAGPVVAAAVVLPENFDILGVDDSKKLTEKKREELAVIIKEKALSWGIGIRDNNRIDEINILEATKEAMADAVFDAEKRLNKKIDHLFIDAVSLDSMKIPQTPITGGDGKSVSIAAASIVAKVYRDHLMKDYASEYPAYSWEKNKGYGTKEHYEAIRENGVSPLHRKTFIKNIADG